jgi:putative membrane protein
METVQDTDVQETKPGRVRLFIGQLSWRIILIRLVVNGLTLIVVAVFVPNIYFVDRSFVSVLLMAVALGILNAFVKPIFQFLTLPFIFATYGFVVILINTIILLLMAAIFDQRFFVGGLVWAIIGGLLMGIIASFLESLLGLNLPIVPKTQEADGSPATGSRTITDLLVSEVAGDEVEQQAPSEDVTEPKGAEDSGEPPAPAIADSGENNSAPTDDEQLVATEGQDLVETQDKADDERQGDEG